MLLILSLSRMLLMLPALHLIWLAVFIKLFSMLLQVTLLII